MTDLMQNAFAGLALGSTYALVALGFVVIYKSTGVINFAHGGLVAVGAYICYSLTNSLGLGFAAAVILACVSTGILGLAIERVVLRRMVGQPPFTVIMVTIGLLFVIEPLLTVLWGFEYKTVPNPWGIETVSVGGLMLGVRDLWMIGITFSTVLTFFLFFRYTRLGLAMRASAFDLEAAMAQGIPVGLVYAVAWAVASATGALAGILVAAAPGGLTPSLGAVALLAVPAMIVGGMDSPAGVVLAGMLIGLAESLTRGYQETVFAWAGDNAAIVVPYALMIAVLLVRPHGILGSKEVRRV